LLSTGRSELLIQYHAVAKYYVCEREIWTLKLLCCIWIARWPGKTAMNDNDCLLGLNLWYAERSNYHMCFILTNC
jgi:hypothetical protein